MAEQIIDNEGVASVLVEQGANPLPTIALGETGFSGLTVLGGQVFEDCQSELRWPQAGETYKKMAKDGAIAPALELIEIMISRVPWVVKIPEGYEAVLKDKAEFLRQNINDLDVPWSSVIRQIVSFNRFGFSVLEKVYGYRRKEEGSKYNDNLIRIKKLPIRAQDSIDSWKWKNKGRELAGLYQNVVVPGQSEDFAGWDFSYTEETVKKFIPRKKFILFRSNPLKDSPTGVSPLAGCWQAWKYKQAYMESEAMRVAQDVNGFKILYLPAQFMKADASDDDKAVFEEYKKILANTHQAKQSGIILPLITDENGNRMFDFEVKSVTGQSSYDTNAIIHRYNAEILSCLFADFLSLGSTGSGSFSLAESKLTVIEMAIESKLNEIKAQLNHDLVPQLFALNGWDIDVLPYFDYQSVAKESLDEISKFVQRVSAVGQLPVVPEVTNWILEKADISYRVDKNMDTESLNKILSPDTSKSGSGMEEGLNNGQGQSTGGSGDSSTGNSENANYQKVSYRMIKDDGEYVIASVNNKKPILMMKEDWEELTKGIQSES